MKWLASFGCVFLCFLSAGDRARGGERSTKGFVPAQDAIAGSIADLWLDGRAEIADRKTALALVGYLQPGRRVTGHTYRIGAGRYLIRLTKPDRTEVRVVTASGVWESQGHQGALKAGWGSFVASLFLAEAEPKVPQEKASLYREEILKATALIHRGMASKAEIAEAQRHMKVLEKEKDAVTAYIALQMVGEDPSKLWSAEPYWVGRYGFVLSRFGEEYACRAAQTLLRDPRTEVRRAGLGVLGIGPRRTGQAADLVVKVLSRDKEPAIQVAGIRALDGLRAVQRADVVRLFLKSPHQDVRRQAVLFFVQYGLHGARSQLEAMLKTETDRETLFFVARALATDKAFDLASLLKSKNSALRQAAMFELTKTSTADVRGADYWTAALPLIEAEKDALCRAQLAYLLASKKRHECVPLLVEMLRWPTQPEKDSGYYTTRDAGHYTKARAMASLCNLTGLAAGLTDEDRRRARWEGANPYDRVAGVVERWYRRHKSELRWDVQRGQFRIAPVR